MSLYDALEKNDDILLTKLITEGIDVNKTIGHYSSTPLHWEVDRGHVECVRVLLKAKADVNKRNCFLSTPIHYAVERSRVECVKLLIEYKASVNLKNEFGWCPLHCAVDKWDVDCIRLLLRAGADVSVICRYGLTLDYYIEPKNRNAWVNMVLESKSK